MNRSTPTLAVVALALLFGLTAPLAGAAPTLAAPAPLTTPFPLTGSITGPGLLALNAVQFYVLNGTGGPAQAANGTIVGNITFYASLSASNLTGISVSPSTGPLGSENSTVSLTVNGINQTVTLRVMISSKLGSANETINLSKSITVTEEYDFSAKVVAGDVTVLSFPVAVTLDGTYLGTVSVPTLSPNGSSDIVYKYPAFRLSSGWHTLTFSIPNSERGLVSFPSGRLSYSFSFYVTGPPPDYTLWIVLGIAAFGAVAFISLVLVGNRRRGRGRA